MKLPEENIKINPWVVPGISLSVNKVKMIKHAVCDYFNIEFSELVNEKYDRHPEYLRPRQFIMFFLREAGFTAKKCAMVFDQSPASAYNAHANITNWIQTDKEIREQYWKISEKMV